MENRRDGYFFWNYLAMGFVFCLTLSNFLETRMFQGLNGFLILGLLCLSGLTILGLFAWIKSSTLNPKKIFLYTPFVFLILCCVSWKLAFFVFLGISFSITIIGHLLLLS